MAGEDSIYSATYSSVPVYEFKIGADNVMRRRVDDWINATHILKVAGLDKPARTRILEREVQKGVHEKVQGGYGKYQGTWIPLPIGRELAERNNILDKLRPIFDFVPGDRSPPPAPKHATAAPSRPRVQRGAANRRTVAPEAAPFTALKPLHPVPSGSFGHEPQFSAVNQSFQDEEADIESSSMMADDDFVPMSQHSTQSRKRKRGMNDVSMNIIEQNHIIYGDQLLDYFMTVGDAPATTRILPPEPPAHFQVDRPIDDHGNTALHWACSMGDIDIVKDLINRGADVGARSDHDETPLVRAVLFTNNYEKGTMQELADLLQDTITFRDWYGATVFNHLAATTRSKGKWKSSRYYCQVLIEKLKELLSPHEISLLLSSQDSSGDTAALSAARNGCYRLATLLLSQCPESGDISNKVGETANDILQTLSRKHKDHHRAPSSVAHQSVHEHEHGASNNFNTDGTSNPQTSAAASEFASNLLARVGSIMEDANRKLALAYGETKWPSSSSRTAEGQGGGEDITNPQGLYEHVEADRANIRKQMEELASSVKSPDGATQQSDQQQTEVLNRVKKEYESLLEQTEKLDIIKRFRAAGCGPDQVTTPSTTPPNTSSIPSTQDLTHLYNLASSLFNAHLTRKNHLQALIQQRADAGVSTKLDVHRKLVSLATGLPEEELDPMSSELAETLEFERGGGGAGAGTGREGRVNGEAGVGTGMGVDGPEGGQRMDGVDSG